eukprot:m.382766 g.382766  ORF g.382766 m.382766 type:complete len:122 (-) comp16724_c1_seq3:9-374(-)
MTTTATRQLQWYTVGGHSGRLTKPSISHTNPVACPLFRPYLTCTLRLGFSTSLGPLPFDEVVCHGHWLPTGYCFGVNSRYVAAEQPDARRILFFSPLSLFVPTGPLRLGIADSSQKLCPQR